MRFQTVVLAALTVTVSGWILALGACHSAGLTGSMSSTSKGAMTQKAVPAANNTVQIAVTDKGFEPARATVVAGKVVTLVVTRKTNETCATSILIPQENIDAKLPLNQPVTLHFTPAKAGELAFMCGEQMLRGSLLVEEQ